MKARKLFAVFACLVLVGTLVVFTSACASGEDTGTTQQTTQTTTGQTTQPTTAETKTLKIGYLGWFGFFIGLDGLKTTEVAAEMINQAGGLTIGDETYMIEIVSYDTNNDQATATAATNKLISEDGVKFILSDGMQIDACIPITEANKVILCASDVSPAILSPDLKYSYNAATGYVETVAAIGWLAETYPDKKSIVVAVPDSQAGQMIRMTCEPALQAFGFDTDFEVFPAAATDLSSLGTKVKQLNPDIYASIGGASFQPYAVVWQAGYRGLMFNLAATATSQLLTQLTPEMLEGFVSAASPTEFDPALNPLAEELKTGWIAKNGQWTEPQIIITSCFYCLVNALEQAGTLDPDAVGSIIGSGLKFDAPQGSSMMISRPDVGNERTVDCVCSLPIKKIVNGEHEIIDTLTPEQVEGYFKEMLAVTPAPSN